MQQFQVPQFITIEDKVIGPMTIKQFLYAGSAALIILLLYQFFTGFFFFLLAAIVGALGGSLAFLKINERPFPIVIKNYFLYMLRPRLYIWRKEKTATVKKSEEVKKQESLVSGIPKLSESKLTDLAWSLDIKQKLRR